MPLHSDTDSIPEYFERLNERASASFNREAMKCCMWKMAHSAERHLERFRLAVRRHRSAYEARDQTALEIEEHTMLALLYEAADTVYIVIQFFDPNILELTSSSDGKGWAGEDAPFVLEIFDMGEQICAKVLQLSQKYDLKLDFKMAVDEREGVTYERHAHWHDLVSDSAEKSFFTYFAQAQRGVTQKLNQKPKFWTNQTLKQALAKTHRAALREIIQRLQLASFPPLSLTAKVEKRILPAIQRHGTKAPEIQDNQALRNLH